MNPAAIINSFRKKGIIVSVEGNQLRFHAPVGTLTAELREILTENKHPILQHLQQHDAHSAIPTLDLRANFAQPPIPLSFAQQRLWFLDQWEPGSTAYLLPYAWRLQGPLNLSALEHSLTTLMTRHESLRTTFSMTDEHPIQHIAPVTPVSLHVLDLTTLPVSAKETELERLLQERTHQPFDLSTGPLWRCQLFRIRPEEHVLLLTLHHIITDGWSMGILLKELTLLYQGQVTNNPVELSPLPLQYSDFTVWQRQWLQGEVLDQQLTYWRTQLANAPSHLDLPTDFPRPPRQTFRGARLAFTLPPKLTQALKTLSQHERVTLFMTLLAAFHILLARYTGQRDILVGTPIAGRTHTDLEGLIGFFVNSVVLRMQVKGQPTFCEVLHQVRETCLKAYSHQDLPFEKIVEALQPARDPSRPPLFQVMFQLFSQQNTPFALSGLHVTRERIQDQSAKFDLNCTLRETADSLEGTLEYSTDLFTAQTVQRFIGYYQHLLEGIVSNPNQPITTLPLLSNAERHQLLVEWTHTARNYPRNTGVTNLFEEQVIRTPEAIAIIFEDQQLSYRELNERANQLAHFFKKRGVGPDVRVGLCLERGLELVTSLLGILKAGGAYVPLDPTYPEERLQYIVNDSKPQFIVTQHGLVPGLEDLSPPQISLTRDWDFFAELPVHNPVSSHTDLNLAYLMYTSGSTGQPKGVMITHEAVVNLLLTLQEHIGVSPTTVLLAVTSLSFDISVFELLGPLINGGRLVLTSKEIAMDGAALTDLLHTQGITLMQATPTTWHMLLQANLAVPPRSLNIISGGEPMAPDLARRLEPWSAQIWNAYGPTETTVWSTLWEVNNQNGKIFIGRPLANTTVILVDHVEELVPIGVPGEIFIGGGGVARGYHQRPDLTAEKFVPHPFSPNPGIRMYRTGDLGRYHPDGALEYLERLDSQVKIRGYRIELGEIEMAMRHHPAVQETVVVCREDSPGEKQLVAYMVPVPETTLEPESLRASLKTMLPDYMLPTAFIQLNTLPLTANGKVNRRALPPPDRTHRTFTATPAVLPRTPLEELVAEVWADLLKVDQIGVHDNFFVLGGHSLLATQLLSRLRNILELDIPLRALFEYPTIAQLAREIDLQLANTFPDYPKDDL